jgi:hypothetical protein
MTTISIDAECNAEFFWDNARRESQHCPIPRFGAWLASRPDKAIELDADEAAVVTSWLAELPGWSGAEYAEYSPHPLIVEERVVARCESGQATGDRCQWAGDAIELNTVEWMPECLRASHIAAGNYGAYPANGVVRLRCCVDCAIALAEDMEQFKASF